MRVGGRMCEQRRKYSIESSRSQARIRNNIFLWWRDSTPNVYVAIGIWNLSFKGFDINSTKGKVIQLDEIYFYFESTQSCLFSTMRTGPHMMNFLSYQLNYMRS